MEDPALRCTCKDTSCPFHPSNHGNGCTPCIRKNRGRDEIPSCFFRAVNPALDRETFYFEDFAEEVLLRAGNRRRSDRAPFRKQYVVDAFTDRPFSGNPAAVCVLDAWPEDQAMQKLASENSLSETAFLVKEASGYRLRWFTPGTEVDLCGHATLASSFVILTYYEPDASEVTFSTNGGPLTVIRKGDLFEMSFPTFELREIPVTRDMADAFGAMPVKAVLGLDLICVFENEETVRSLNPDQPLLARLPGRLQNATARGKDTDCVSRSFCPKVSVPEDPVCGSAHCQIADYWATVLGKSRITAWQASKRGGYLECELLGGGRIAIRGKAVPVAVSDILVRL